MFICKQSGDCCNLFEVTLPSTNESRAALIRKVENFLGLKFKSVGRISVRLEATCSEFDTATRLCKSYNQRPVICREFYCGRYKDGEEGK